MVTPGQNPDPSGAHKHPAQSSVPSLSDRDILNSANPATAEGRALLVGIIVRGARRNVLEDVQAKLAQHLPPKHDDPQKTQEELREILSQLVSVFTNPESSILQRLAVHGATKAIRDKMNQTLTLEMLKSPDPDTRAALDQELPKVSLIDNLQRQFSQAILREDLNSIAFRLDFIESAQKSSQDASGAEQHTVTLRSLIDELRKKEHFILLPEAQRELLQRIYADPTGDPRTLAANVRSYHGNLASVETAGKVCLDVLQMKDTAAGSFKDLDPYESTRVRVKAAEFLNVFKHISNSIREQYPAIATAVIASTPNFEPEKHLRSYLEAA